MGVASPANCVLVTVNVNSGGRLQLSLQLLLAMDLSYVNMCGPYMCAGWIVLPVQELETVCIRTAL